MAITLVDHSSKDGTGDAINGSEVDENPNTLNNVLNGVTATPLNASGLWNWAVTPGGTDSRGVRMQVYNSGSTIAAGSLVYISTYNTTQVLYEISKAVVTQATSTTHFATWIVDTGGVSGSASGYVTSFYPVNNIDTSLLTIDAHVWLSHTAGLYNTSRTSHPDVDYLKQIIGKVTKVHATLGSIALFAPGWVIPWSIADQV